LPLLLVADDLTGACDASVCFVDQGFTAKVRLDGCLSDAANSTNMLALVTHTRNLEADQAGQRIKVLLGGSNLKGMNIFHKVDSAGRGNPGAELASLAALSGCEAVVYAPALPAAGRVVREGHLHVTDFCGQNQSVPLRSLIPDAVAYRIAQIPAGSVAQIRQTLADAHSASRNFWICDACSEQDLDALVEAASSLNLHLLWSGSAGLAAAVARHQAPRKPSAALLRLGFEQVRRTLLVSGTDHPVTMAQLAHLPASAVELHMDAESQPDFNCGWIQMDWARATPDQVRGFWQRLHKADSQPITSLLLTGGETAAFVLEALGAVSLRIGGELQQGIPWSIAEGGVVDGTLVITKSGGFGTPESLAQCAEFSQRIMR
jgi:uncharacterized protein YgbK (DUF1537 family)